MSNRKRLLWTDDDGRDWFVYEEHMLRAEGWDVRWARDLDEATGLLAAEPFDALVLDQMLPFTFATIGAEPHARRLWGGCLLLWWLRQRRWPDRAPYTPDLRAHPVFARAPLAQNLGIPAIAVSAFYDEQVEQATRAASGADSELQILAKPVRLADLLDFLTSAAPPEEQR